MRTVLLIGVVIVALVLGKLFIFSKPGKDKPESGKNGGKGDGKSGGAIPVNVYVVGRQSVENEIFASGTVLPNEEVDLKAEISGRLVKLNISEGALVSKGQLIAKINDRDLKAQYQKIEYNQDLARKIEARQKKLLNVEAINLQDYDVTANDIRILDADKELLESQLEKTEIRAPFSGRIGLKNISEGAYVAPGTSIVTIVQNNPVKVDFTIPEKYSAEVQIGNVIKFRTDGNSADFEAKIVALDPKVDEVLRTRRVRALASNPSGRFVPGMFVNVKVNLAANKNAIMIPSEAIVPVLKGKKVFLVKNGKATEAMIVTGLRTDTKVQVIEGLQTGDSLITSGIIALKADAAVKVNK